ncbi:hypothetical protein B1L11_41380 [Microbispora sp. GKU 823]|nr:hypothetical protein B1L11_41380 [Microbispora sp. GKU 823]
MIACQQRGGAVAGDLVGELDDVGVLDTQAARSIVGLLKGLQRRDALRPGRVAGAQRAPFRPASAVAGG